MDDSAERGDQLSLTKVPIVYADQWNAHAMSLLLLEQLEVNQSLVY